jgi:hypothetical protein
VRTIALSLLPLLLVSGCGRRDYQVAPVAGRIYIDDKPAGNVHVAFEPIGSKESPNPGPGSIGVTDANGYYTLTTVRTKERGAVVGKHRVLIRTQGMEDDEESLVKGLPPRKKVQRPKQLPVQFNEETKLRFDVPPEGSDQADFRLAWK